MHGGVGMIYHSTSAPFAVWKGEDNHAQAAFLDLRGFLRIWRWLLTSSQFLVNEPRAKRKSCMALRLGSAVLPVPNLDLLSRRRHDAP
jgi:hypothetical protein